MKSYLSLGVLACAAALLLTAGCDNEETSYRDADSTDVSKDWSSTDIKNASGELGKKLAEFVEKDADIANFYKTNNKKPAILCLDIKKETDEHLDTEIIVSQIETAILQTGKVTFIAGKNRQDLTKEYAYMASGAVDPKTQKAPGKQTGAEYVLVGEIRNVRARLNDKSTVNYYYIALKMVNVTTSEICWKGENETKKRTTK
jgi:uncharacterized protein (TIGR02722 family)